MSVNSQSSNFSMKSQAAIDELRKQKMLQDQEILLLHQLVPAQALQEFPLQSDLQRGQHEQRSAPPKKRVNSGSIGKPNKDPRITPPLSNNIQIIGRSL